MYDILAYTKQRAKELNVIIKQSRNNKQKIDVYDLKNNFICSVGAINYYDYPHYLRDYGLEIANKKRKLYRNRHKNEIKKLGDRWVGSKSYYAWNLLW